MSHETPAEAYEIENAIRDRLKLYMPTLQVSVADDLGADMRWLVQQPPVALVVAIGEELDKDDKQPIDPTKIYRVDIQIKFVFSGMRPRDDNRITGHPIMTTARDVLWHVFRVPGTMTPLIFRGWELEGENEKLRFKLYNQYYKTRVARRPLQPSDLPVPDSYSGGGQTADHGGYSG